MAGVLPYTWIKPNTGTKSNEPWVLISEERGGPNKGTWDMFSGGKDIKDLTLKATAAREAAEESCEMIGTMQEIESKIFGLNGSPSTYLMKIANPSKINNTEYLKRKKWNRYQKACYQEKTEIKWVKLSKLIDACVNHKGILKSAGQDLHIRPYFSKIIAKNKDYFEKNFLAGLKAAPQPGAKKPIPFKPVAPQNAWKDEVWEDKIKWSQKIATTVNQFFKQPYKDKPDSLKMDIQGKSFTVYRPNHALAHGLRQGFLAVDVIDLLWKQTQVNTVTLNSADGQNIKPWVKDKILHDPYFKQKVEFTSAFQRTGRQSEVSSAHDLALYNSYERADAANFRREVQPYIGAGKLFKDQQEANVFEEAILWSTANEGKIDPTKNQDLYFLRKVFHTAHDLDLRRIKKFDIDRIKASAIGELFGDHTVDKNTWKVLPQFSGESRIIDALWKRSGEYLSATGDRDVVTQRGYAPKFCELAYNPEQMALALRDARKKSTATV